TDDLLKHVAAEFDHRIKLTPKDREQYCAKASYFYNAHRSDEALAAAVTWARAFPDSVAARRALRDIERFRDAGIMSFHMSTRYEHLWKVKRKTFAEWCLYNTPKTNDDSYNNYPAAITLPIASNEAG